MGKPAARVNDMHTCPTSDGPKPHVGGPIVGPGAPTVLSENSPIAVMGDVVTCQGPPDTIVTASATVFAENKQVARMTDSTAHGGVIVGGSPFVLVDGSGAPPQVERLQRSTDGERPLCEVCEDCGD